jgi:hypothetical protein
MNCYEARQREVDGRWDWTVMNDGIIRRAGPCRDHEDGHSTKEEAERHYWDYELSRLKEHTTGGHYPCEVCGALTNKELSWHHIGPTARLCDDHRSREQFERLNPFEPGLSVVSSW